MSNQKQEQQKRRLDRQVTPEAVVFGLKQYAAMNNVFVTFLDVNPPETGKAGNAMQQYMAAFAETEELLREEDGKEVIRENLRSATSAGDGMVYCPCRIVCITPQGNDDLLKRYADACRTIRETAAIRELFRVGGYPLPQYLPIKTVEALCHFREKLSDDTLSQEVRERYGQCLRRLVQEAHGRGELKS